ncbi:MAG: hypothetical protein V5A44_06080 [Haloarculaceae archaeon]
MTRYLLATASVHTTAAAADYLGPRLAPDDEVLGPRRGDPDARGAAPGSTVRSLLGDVDVPVVVVPLDVQRRARVVTCSWRAGSVFDSGGRTVRYSLLTDHLGFHQLQRVFVASCKIQGAYSTPDYD